MGWSRRGAGLETDPSLPMFSGPAAHRFVALAREVFAELGMETSYADGCLRGTDGQLFGLGNVAHLAASQSPRRWRRVVEAHVAGLLVAHATPKERDLAKVVDRLFLRLWPTADSCFGTDARLPFADGLVAMASIDHPEHVETLTLRGDIEELGGWDVVARTAGGNLARLSAERTWVQSSSGGRGQVLASLGGFFNASRVLAMPHLLKSDFLIEPPAAGVLFAVPNRHLVLLHPVEESQEADAAAAVMRTSALVECETSGGISPEVWHWSQDGVRRWE